MLKKIILFKSLIITLSFTIIFIGISFGKQPVNTIGHKDTLRLLLIGNSFSWNATRFLPELAAEAGFPLKIERAALAGCSLKRHWGLVELAEKDPENQQSKQYDGKSLKEILEETKWDIISLQQVSILSGDICTYRPYAWRLYNFIKDLRPKAKIVMLQTWAYRSDSEDFSQIAENWYAKNGKEMWEKSRAAYRTIADELDVDIVPVGDAFALVSKSKKWRYKEDTAFNKTKAVYPELPGQAYSLHRGYFWDENKELQFDSHHASEAGCYLGSLVWYSFIFKTNPAIRKFSPENVSEDFARYLKIMAWYVTKN